MNPALTLLTTLLLASLLNTEVLTLWEHFRHSGAWRSTAVSIASLMRSGT